jgi:HSP20 family molecular chaperone IbpA
LVFIEFSLAWLRRNGIMALSNDPRPALRAPTEVSIFPFPPWLHYREIKKEGTEMPESRMKVAPDTVAYADSENRKLIVEFAIPGAPAETVDLKMLEDSVHLAAPARDIEYVASLALSWAVKPAKAEATYEHGLLRIEVPFKDPMEDAVKVVVKAGGAETKTKIIAGK